MKVLVVTDIHDDEVAARSAFEVEKPDFVLDCGDHKHIKNIFEFAPHLYVFGNHEPPEILVDNQDMPLPFRIPIATRIVLREGANLLNVGGVGGNYSFDESFYSITEKRVKGLESFSPRSLDVVLLHESPLNVLNFGGRKYAPLATRVVEEIDRIKPKFVFAGHAGEYKVDSTPGKVKIVTLDEMRKGYGILSVEGNDLNFERKRAVF